MLGLLAQSNLVYHLDDYPRVMTSFSQLRVQRVWVNLRRVGLFEKGKRVIRGKYGCGAHVIKHSRYTPSTHLD